MAEVGIDLGTTNSAVAVLRGKPEAIENQGRATTPSAVAYDSDQGVIIVGHAAKDQAAQYGAIISVKRDMGTDKRFRLGESDHLPEEISAMILKELKAVAEERLGEPVDGAVITIPAYFTGAQAEATKRAGEKAGIKNIRLLAEPIAAARAYRSEDIVLVYDLGGGTFDVAIIDCLDYMMIGLDGDPYLGGDDFDKRLVTYLAKEVKAKFGVDIESSAEALQVARSECEKAKIRLSKMEATRIAYTTAVNGKLVNINLPISRQDFENMVMELVERTLTLVGSAIKRAEENEKTRGRSFSQKDIQTVLLVGGSTYIPLVRRKVAEYFGRDPATNINPDLAVALGAAIQAASGPAPKGVHWIRLDSLPMVTAATECKVEGRTTPGSRVEITGGAAPITGTADERGKFSFKIELRPDAASEVTVTSTDQGGEVRKAGCQVRHESGFTGEEDKGPDIKKKTETLLPRGLGIGVSGDDNRLGVIIPGQTAIPCNKESRGYIISSAGANLPGMCPIEVFEGDLPYAPLNTQLASLMLETAASPSPQEPLEITFQVLEDRSLTVTARMVNFPDRVVTSRCKLECPSGAKLHVIERTERLLNTHADKLRPEEKAKLQKTKQGLLDVCEQYRRDPEKDKYDRIKTMGLQLRADLDRLEAVGR